LNTYARELAGRAAGTERFFLDVHFIDDVVPREEFPDLRLGNQLTDFDFRRRGARRSLLLSLNWL